MKIISGHRKKWILTAIITALAIAMGCVFAACTKVQAESSDDSPEPADRLLSDVLKADDAFGKADTSVRNYSHWLSDHYSADVITREMWLADLMRGLELPLDEDADPAAIFDAAYRSGLIDSAQAEPYAALTRRYVAHTLVKALHYQPRSADYVTDLASGDADMLTVTYYGWFLPDDYGMVYPDALITADEYVKLTEEVQRYRCLSGRQILSFGDSIMYGMGNSGSGISDMVGEKYGMTVHDFAASGAAFGVDQGRGHIPDQIKAAAKNGLKPDVILINGGTNDIEHVKRGNITDGKDVGKIDERTFAGGFEYSASLLQKYWKGVPVIYIRAHDMDRVKDELEQDYGELALAVAEKWGLDVVDIYRDTDFCTEYGFIRDDYTVYKTKLGKSDGVHPTALGYAKYYVPRVSAKIEAIFSR